MLDLNFVRDNLPWSRRSCASAAWIPAEVLKDFHEVDTQRRQAITEAETMKARRNRASEEIAKLKKSGQDATAQIVRNQRIARADPATGESGRRSRSHACRIFSPAFPTCRTKACR